MAIFFFFTQTEKNHLTKETKTKEQCPTFNETIYNILNQSASSHLANGLKWKCPAYHPRGWKQTAWGNKVKGKKGQFHLLVWKSLNLISSTALYLF